MHISSVTSVVRILQRGFAQKIYPQKHISSVLKQQGPRSCVSSKINIKYGTIAGNSEQIAVSFKTIIYAFVKRENGKNYLPWAAELHTIRQFCFPAILKSFSPQISDRSRIIFSFPVFLFHLAACAFAFKMAAEFLMRSVANTIFCVRKGHEYYLCGFL